jgi:hypothetical protein
MSSPEAFASAVVGVPCLGIIDSILCRICIRHSAVLLGAKWGGLAGAPLHRTSARKLKC